MVFLEFSTKHLNKNPENQVEFWINGNSVATHTTNLPDIMPHFMIYNASESGGASTVDLGFCRVFYRGFDDARSF